MNRVKNTKIINIKRSKYFQIFFIKFYILNISDSTPYLTELSNLFRQLSKL